MHAMRQWAATVLAAPVLLCVACDTRTTPPPTRSSPVENDPFVRLAIPPPDEARDTETAQTRHQHQTRRPPSTPPAPFNDPKDRSVHQVKTYLAETLKEPDSIRYLHWSPVMQTDRGYQVVCTYAARAGSFGMVTEKKVFHMTPAGRVTMASPVRRNLSR